MMRFVYWLAVAIGTIPSIQRMVFADQPPAINPFGQPTTEREDAVPGYVELSDGSIHPGLIYLTRDKRLVIADEKTERQREIPLSAVKQIDCTIIKEWLEKEWKFKESAKDDKIYSGQSYPAREYEHTITMNDGRTITGGLSAIVYVQSSNKITEQFILNKRNKGEIGKDLQSLVYVKTIKLGNKALEEGQKKAAVREKQKGTKK
jgi:hypothetical protein